MKYSKIKIEKNYIKNFNFINFINKFCIMFKYSKIKLFLYKSNNYVFFMFKKRKINNIFFYNYDKLIKSFLYLFCGFSYSKIFLKIGLGFRKKYSRKYKLSIFNVVRRKIVIFNAKFNSFFFHIRRRNIYLYCNSKKKLFYFIVCLKSMRNETIYKFKGIFTNLRVKIFKKLTRSILFARRIKLKKLKLKLTKKQKLKK